MNTSLRTGMTHRVPLRIDIWRARSDPPPTGSLIASYGADRERIGEPRRVGQLQIGATRAKCLRAPKLAKMASSQPLRKFTDFWFIERLFGGDKIIGQPAQNRGDIAGQHNRENGKEQAAPENAELKLVRGIRDTFGFYRLSINQSLSHPLGCIGLLNVPFRYSRINSLAKWDASVRGSATP
jgi:hypothetical protein